MGGAISVESVPGEGSTFTMTLPVDLEAPRAARVETSAGPAVAPVVSAAARRILVIDDDPHGRELVGRFLAREGFDVTTCGNGPEGIRQARAMRPDAILLDVLMPGMDGWSVLSVLKGDPELGAIPIVMVTMVTA